MFNNRLHNGERSLVDGFREIEGLVAGLNLPTHIGERARYRYAKVVKNDLLQGRCIEAFAAASVLITIREYEHPVTMADLVEVSPISEDRIKTHRSIFHSEFSIGIQPTMPQHFLQYVLSDLPTTHGVERKAIQLLKIATDDGCHIGNHPAGFAAAAVYALVAESDTNLSQKVFAEAADVSVATICRNYQKISEYVDSIDCFGAHTPKSPNEELSA